MFKCQTCIHWTPAVIEWACLGCSYLVTLQNVGHQDGHRAPCRPTRDEWPKQSLILAAGGLHDRHLTPIVPLVIIVSGGRLRSRVDAAGSRRNGYPRPRDYAHPRDTRTFTYPGAFAYAWHTDLDPGTDLDPATFAHAYQDTGPNADANSSPGATHLDPGTDLDPATFTNTH